MFVDIALLLQSPMNIIAITKFLWKFSLKNWNQWSDGIYCGQGKPKQKVESKLKKDIWTQQNTERHMGT